MPALSLRVRQVGPVIESPGRQDDWNWRAVAKPEDLVLESWSQGLVVGSLMLMACITLANMHKGVLLHKLIFAEQAMALTHGTFCFMNWEGYGWYLSSTAALLYLSYILHNVVAWMKVKPFFHGRSSIFAPKFVKWTTRIYTCSLALTVPPVLFQITDNFRYFNGYGGWYKQVRPYEPLMRDPWWVFTSGILFYVISKTYGMGVWKIIQMSPRFGILFTSIILALIFTGLDIAASIHSFIGSTDGINPFWKLSLIFKCLTDAILLDDFKTELKRLGLSRIRRDEKRRESQAVVLEFDDRLDSDDEAAAHFSNGFSRPSPDRTSELRHQRQPNGRILENKHQDRLSADLEEVEFTTMLDDQSSHASNDRRRYSEQSRRQVGQGGVPIMKLPRFFTAIKPGKTSSALRRNSHRVRRDINAEPQYHDASLERAKLEQQRTIEELIRRRESAKQEHSGIAEQAFDGTPAFHTNASKDFWTGLSKLRDKEQ